MFTVCLQDTWKQTFSTMDSTVQTKTKDLRAYSTPMPLNRAVSRHLISWEDSMHWNVTTRKVCTEYNMNVFGCNGVTSYIWVSREHFECKEYETDISYFCMHTEKGVCKSDLLTNHDILWLNCILNKSNATYSTCMISQITGRWDVTTSQSLVINHTRLAAWQAHKLYLSLHRGQPSVCRAGKALRQRRQWRQSAPSFSAPPPWLVS